jgi:dienelactone hydrolase
MQCLICLRSRMLAATVAVTLLGSDSVAVGQDRAGIVHTDIAASMSTAKLSMLFTGSTPNECRTWQQTFGAKLNELLGESDPPEDWTVKEESRAEFADHVRYEFLLEAKGVASLPVYLLLPRSASRTAPVPAVMCIHGHGEFGHHPVVGRRDLEGVTKNIDDHNYDYGLQFVRRGYAVVAPCMIPFGRRVDRGSYRGNDPCAVTFVRMQALGRLPIAANLRDLRWSIDLLQSRPEVDGTRIGCAGLSTGGRMTMMVTATDDRIRVAAVSGALNLMQERMTNRYTCGSQVIPGLLNVGDYSAIGSLIAPRPCVWETGSVDDLIVPEWDDVFRSRLCRAYDALGAADQLHFDRFEGDA